MPYLLSLPDELLLEIIQHLHYASDINAASQTCRHIWRLADPRLYPRYALDCSPRSLERITENGNVDALRRLFSAGAGFFPTENSARSHRPRNKFVPYRLAMANGHLEIARLLVEVYGTGIVDIASLTDDTIFGAAVRGGHSDVIRYLLDIAAPPDRPGCVWPSHSNLLYVALRCCSLPFFRSLVEDPRCDVNVPDRFGRPILWAMVEYGTPDAVEILLDAGADPLVEHPSADYERIPLIPLYHAALYNREDMVRIFLQRGAHGDLRKSLNPKFLARMTKRHGPSIPALILEHIDMDSWLSESTQDDRANILSTVAANGDAHLVRQILEVGLDLTADLEEPLELAAKYGHVEVVNSLLPPELPEKGQVPRPYEVAHIAACMGKQKSVIDLLFERIGSKLWTISGDLIDTALAKAGEDVDFTKYLFEKGAVLMLESFNRQILCEGALTSDNFQLLEQVMNQLGIPGYPTTPTKGIGGSRRYHGIFQEAAIFGSVEVFKFLLDRGAVLDPRNRAWENVLILAAGSSQLDIVKLFLDNGFDVNTRYGISGIPDYTGWESESETDADADADANPVVEINTDTDTGDTRSTFVAHATLLEVAIFGNLCYLDFQDLTDSPKKTETVRLILDRGADIYTKNAQNQYLFEALVEKGGSTSILQEFLSRGVNPLISSNDDQQNAWTYAAKPPRSSRGVFPNKNLENTKLLLQHIMYLGLPGDEFRDLIPEDENVPVNTEQLAEAPSGGPSRDWYKFEIAKKMWGHYWTTKYPVPEL